MRCLQQRPACAAHEFALSGPAISFPPSHASIAAIFALSSLALYGNERRATTASR
jgi:hypothetical protein